MSSSSLELPCLAFHRRDDHATSLYTMSEENNLIAITAPNAGDTNEILRNKTICPTARGFLLARDPDTMATFLWRPPQDAAGDRMIHLPPLRGPRDGVLMHSHCLLSGDPCAPGCVVLLLEGADNFMWYCRPGDEQWVKHEYDIGTYTLPDLYEGSMYMKIPICPIAACRGKFYFNGTYTELGVLEFCPDPVFSSIAIDESYESEEEDDDEEYEEEDDDDEEYEEEEGYRARRPNPGQTVFLVESGDELYKVNLLYATSCYDEVDEAIVVKMDFSSKRWRYVDDLGGRTFLLSSSYFGASCCKGDSWLQKDCAYFLNERRKEMQVFNVREDTSELHKLDEAQPYDKELWLLPSTSP